MTRPDDRGSVARFLYTSYGWSADWKNFRGEPMPQWADLPEAIREHWLVVADSSVELAKATDAAAPALQAAATIASGLLAHGVAGGDANIAERAVAIANLIAEQLQIRKHVAEKWIRELEEQRK